MDKASILKNQNFYLSNLDNFLSQIWDQWLELRGKIPHIIILGFGFNNFEQKNKK